MDKRETIDIVATICASYPSTYEKMSTETIKAMTRVWSTVFADDDKAMVELAVAVHVSTCKFPPTVAEIRAHITGIKHPELVPPDRAWEAVKGLMRSLSEFESDSKLRDLMPDLIYRTVRTIGWNTLFDLSKGRHFGIKAGADEERFMAFYRPAYERELERLMIPAGVDAALQGYEAVYGTTDDVLRKMTACRRAHENEIKKITSLFDDEPALSGTEQPMIAG